MINTQGILNTNYMVADALQKKMDSVQSEIDSLLKEHTKENYTMYLVMKTPKGIAAAEKEIPELKTKVNQMLELHRIIEDIWTKIDEIAKDIYSDKLNIN